MDVSPKLMQYRYHFTFAIIGSLILGLLSFAIAAPRLLDILAYFGPLFASTTVFLLLIIVFGGISQMANEAQGERAGEGLLDYVAGPPEHIGESHSHRHE